MNAPLHSSSVTGATYRVNSVGIDVGAREDHLVQRQADNGRERAGGDRRP